MLPAEDLAFGLAIKLTSIAAGGLTVIAEFAIQRRAAVGSNGK